MTNLAIVFVLLDLCAILGFASFPDEHLGWYFGIVGGLMALGLFLWPTATAVQGVEAVFIGMLLRIAYNGCEKGWIQ